MVTSFVGADELGLTAPYDVVHHAEEATAGVAGPVGGWFVATLGSALLGLVVGLFVVAAVHSVTAARRGRRTGDGATQHH